MRNLQLLATQELPDGDILAFDSSLLVTIGVQLLNVLLLTAIVVFILYKPVKRFMAARRKRIETEIEDARLKTEEAETLYAKYQALLESAHTEREEILRAARRASMERGDAMLAQARREVELIHLRASTEIELERKNVEEAMKREIVELAMLMAGRFVSASIDGETQQRYIDSTFAEWTGGSAGEE